MNVGAISGYLDLEEAPFAEGLESAFDKLKEFGGKGAAIAAVAGLAIATAIGVSIAAAMDVEKANDKLAAQLGLTAQESERIGGVAGKLYAQAYGDSLEDVNEAVGAVVSTIDGMRTASDDQVEAMTAKAMNLAKTFDLDVTEAVNSVGIVMKSGLAKNADEAFDLITAAMQKMPASMRGELLEATDEYGKFFNALGVTGEQAFGMLAEASKQGTYGIDKTGDAIKELTIRATDMSATSVAAYESMGLSAQDMSNRILAGGDQARGAFSKIVNGLLGIKDPTDQANAALSLFGTPLEDLGVNQIPQFLQSLKAGETSLGDVAGAADRMGQTLNDNAASNFESFKRQIEMIVVGFGANFLPLVNLGASVLATVLGPALNAVGGFLRDNSTAIAIVAGVIGTLMIPRLIIWAQTTATAAAINSATWIKGQIEATRSAAIQVASWTMMGARAIATGAMYVAAFVMMGAAAIAQTARTVAMTVAMGVWMTMTNAVRAATIAWTAVQWLLNAALTANPIGIVIVAIAALIAGIILLWNNCEWFRNAILAVWAAIQTAVKVVVDWLVNTAWPFIKQVWDWIVAGAQLLWTGIQLYWQAIWTIIQTVVGWISEYVVSKFTAAKAAALLIWEALKAGISLAVNAIKSVINTIGSIVSTVIGFFGRIKDGIVDKWNAALDFVKGIPGKIVNVITDAKDKFLNAGKAIIQGLIDGIGAMVQKVKDAVGNVLEAARNLLPHSPAKEGPFSGDGWTLYSGESLMDAFATGITNSGGKARNALENELRSISGLLPSSGLRISANTEVSPQYMAEQRPAANGGHTFIIKANDRPTPKVILSALNEYEVLQPPMGF